MGEVYRATDTNLDREVAIKVLPSEVAEDPERLGRFKREAHLLAALNHPNIAAIYGLEEVDGKPFLALELVEGEELKERLARGAIPVDDALEIAEQIAEALEEAHNKGIVHRDLKPANVKITPDGKVKVLDFGLAKAWAGDALDGSSSSPALSQSPTMANTGTVAGLILGTAAYMSPEQARGKPVDKRADVWSFGVLAVGDADRPHALRRRHRDRRHRLGGEGGARPRRAAGGHTARGAPAARALPAQGPAHAAAGHRGRAARAAGGDRGHGDRGRSTGRRHGGDHADRAPPSHARAVGLGRGRRGPGRDRRGPPLPAPDRGARASARRSLRRRDARGPGLPWTSVRRPSPPTAAASPSSVSLPAARRSSGFAPWTHRRSGRFPGREGAGGPFWSPDSTSIAFACRGRDQEAPPRGRDRPPGLRAPCRTNFARGHMECRGHDRLLGRRRNREPVLGLGGGRRGPAPHAPRRVAGRDGPLAAPVPARRAPPPLRDRAAKRKSTPVFT